ncbi:SpoIIE family protein phosphatase [bacterium]|nr:SpoIIE family protein phosphatase [bacterium]
MSPEKPNRFAQELELLHSRIEALKADNAKLRQQAEQAAAQLNNGNSHQDMKHLLDASRRQMHEISRVHSRFLPMRFPMMGGLEFAAHCRPCADVGGDFYDVINLPDGRIAVAMADVSGHGASAAVAMATARALLRAALADAFGDTGPAEILMMLSRWMQGQLEIEQFVTMWLGVWDPASEELQYASAAHPPAVIWNNEDRDPTYLRVSSTTPLGLTGVEPLPAEEGSVSLEIGDRVFLYTDGWNESPSVSGKFLEGDAFLELLANSEGQPASQVPLMLFTEFERHAANSRIRDDISLLVFDRLH